MSLAFLSLEYLIFMISLIFLMYFFVSGEYNTEHCFVQNFVFGKIQIEKYLVLFSSKNPQFSHVGNTYKGDSKYFFHQSRVFVFFLLHFHFL